MTTTDQKGYSGAERGKSAEAIGGFIGVVALSIVFVLVVRSLLFQFFNIPSGSMIPTLLIGDYLAVSKYSYGFSNHSFPSSPHLFKGRIFFSPPKRGDVVVFKLPRDGQTDYVKRVIGLPGDTIQMKDGRLYINGAIVPREPIAKVKTEDLFGRQREVATYKETLPGGNVHTIVEVEGDTGFYDNTAIYKVPAGDYFMMGDNRDNSTDSRIPPEQGGVGYVPAEDLVGRAEIIFFSAKTEWPWTVRWDRLFQFVR